MTGKNKAYRNFGWFVNMETLSSLPTRELTRLYKESDNPTVIERCYDILDTRRRRAAKKSKGTHVVPSNENPFFGTAGAWGSVQRAFLRR